MTSTSLRRIGAVFTRYLIPHRRSLVRAFDIFFWPVMNLLVWGFMSLYIQKEAGGPITQTIVFVIGAMISWDLHYHSQLAVAVSTMEEIWTRNLTNILVAPVRLWEWIAGTLCYATLKVGMILGVLAVVAQLLYTFNLVHVGWAFLPLVANLMCFGWSMGLFTAGLLLRFGYAAEALIWGIPVLILPFSCVFYPVSILPGWAQAIARYLPSAYVFEGLRAALQHTPVPWTTWPVLIGLNLAYGIAGVAFLVGMFRRSRALGHLGRLGQD